MTDHWRAWLPWEVADQAVARAAVLDIVEAWTADWFGGCSFGAPAWRSARAPVPGSGASGEWIRRDAGVALHLPVDGQLDLIGLALQMDTQSVDLTETDHQLLSAFGKRMLLDLVERLDARVGAAQTGRPVDHGHLELSLSSRDMRQGIRLYLPFHAVVALHRAARPLRASAATLTPMAAALADTPVPIRAFLGSATVNFEDLRGLSPGDTLVLSTPLEGVVDIAAGDQDASFATANLLQEDQRLVLRLNC